MIITCVLITWVVYYCRKNRCLDFNGFPINFRNIFFWIFWKLHVVPAERGAVANQVATNHRLVWRPKPRKPNFSRSLLISCIWDFSNFCKRIYWQTKIPKVNESIFLKTSEKGVSWEISDTTHNKMSFVFYWKNWRV